MSAQLKVRFRPSSTLIRRASDGEETAVMRAGLPQPVSARAMAFSRRHWVLGIGALIVIASRGRHGLAPVVSAQAGGCEAPIPVQTITVGPVVQAPIGRSLVVNGSLAAWDELPVGTEAGGLAITQVAVEEGDRVTKGQLLAKLDDSVLRAQLAQAQASVAQAEAGVRKAEAMAGTASSDVRRAKELVEKRLYQRPDSRTTRGHPDHRVRRCECRAAEPRHHAGDSG